MKFKKLPLILLLTLITSLSFCQQKIEKEYVIKENKVPKNISLYVLECFPNNKIKWFKEDNLEGSFFEAKTKKNKITYSIKFDINGNFLDVELKVPFKNLPENIQQTINSQFSNLFTKYKIEKSQIQWLGNKELIKNLILEKSISKNYTINYEIEVKGRKKQEIDFYEFLFDKNGKIIKEQKVAQSSIQHLLF